MSQQKVLNQHALSLRKELVSKIKHDIHVYFIIELYFMPIIYHNNVSYLIIKQVYTVSVSN